jgi:intracellular sulfur oxidation DsrE/DsrF family protein
MEGTPLSKRLLLLSDRIGRDSDDLGKILMKNFLYAVARAEETPLCVMLMNGAVRLACEGSDSVDDLRILAEDGVEIKACGTCLDFLGVKDGRRGGCASRRR